MMVQVLVWFVGGAAFGVGLFYLPGSPYPLFFGVAVVTFGVKYLVKQRKSGERP